MWQRMWQRYRLADPDWVGLFWTLWLIWSCVLAVYVIGAIK